MEALETGRPRSLFRSPYVLRSPWRSQLRRFLRPVLLFFLLPFIGTAWLGRRKEETREIAEERPVVDVDFVELEVPGPAVRFQIHKLYFPLAPPVAHWMNKSDLKFSSSIETPLAIPPRIHVVIKGEPLQIGNVTAKGIHTILELPENVDPRACKVAVIVASADIGSEPSGGAFPTRALLLVCQVQQSAKDSLQNSSRLLLQKGPLRWLLVPWLVLLLPLIVGSAMGPMALLAGAALTLASIACLSFLIAILIVILQRRCLHCTRKYRRLWRLRRLQRRPSQIDAAFGDSGPCCICLGDADSRDALIALLPCRHALHATCYSSWVSADAYPSSSLICPVCRCRADSIGKLSPTTTT